MKKKLISLLSAVLCLCMMLSACGGPTNSDRQTLHLEAKMEQKPLLLRL